MVPLKVNQDPSMLLCKCGHHDILSPKIRSNHGEPGCIYVLYAEGIIMKPFENKRSYIVFQFLLFSGKTFSTDFTHRVYFGGGAVLRNFHPLLCIGDNNSSLTFS